MITQEMLNIAMQELAEARARETQAKLALYEAIAWDAVVDHVISGTEAAEEHRRHAIRLSELEDTLRVARLIVQQREDRVRDLEQRTSRWQP